MRERAVRVVRDHAGDHASQWAAIGSIAPKIGCTPETLRTWVRRSERDQGTRAGHTTAKRDASLRPEIAYGYDENFHVYGVRKVRRQQQPEGHEAARCTVARPMKRMGLQGVIRGKSVKTTISDKAAPCPLDHVNRRFKTPPPNVLWDSDFAYVATWMGFVYVATDCFADGSPRGHRHRYVRPTHRRLACVSNGTCQLRARCS